MKKIGIFGYFSFEKMDYGGQPIKTNEVYNYLKKIYKSNEIVTFDTIIWTKSKIKSFLKFIIFFIRSKNIIIMPASNGIQKISKLILVLDLISLRKRIVHYIVIGGWLPNLVSQNNGLRLRLQKFDYIYVETLTMLKLLNENGLNNIVLMKNVKETEQHLNEYCDNEILRFCFYSRVIAEKGIEDAISVIKKINSTIHDVTCCLDIFGPVEVDYLKKLSVQFDENIRYKGIIDSKQGSKILSHYFMQLFPTKFYTEGVPGSVIDGFFAGLPILASDWESSIDVISEFYNGILFDFGNLEDFFDKMKWIISNISKINKMRVNCINSSVEFIPSNSLKPLLRNLKGQVNGNK